jgi:uncharacterized protein YllA (UPF0747 family)
MLFSEAAKFAKQLVDENAREIIWYDGERDCIEKFIKIYTRKRFDEFHDFHSLAGNLPPSVFSKNCDYRCILEKIVLNFELDHSVRYSIKYKLRNICLNIRDLKKRVYAPTDR